MRIKQSDAFFETPCTYSLLEDIKWLINHHHFLIRPPSLPYTDTYRFTKLFSIILPKEITFDLHNQ